MCRRVFRASPRKRSSCRVGPLWSRPHSPQGRLRARPDLHLQGDHSVSQSVSRFGHFALCTRPPVIFTHNTMYYTFNLTRGRRQLDSAHECGWRMGEVCRRPSAVYIDCIEYAPPLLLYALPARKTSGRLSADPRMERLNDMSAIR